MQRIDVLYRKFDDGDLIALFPYTEKDCNAGFIMSYQVVGQHSEASKDLLDVLGHATDEEKESMEAELRFVGYDPHDLERKG